MKMFLIRVACMAVMPFINFICFYFPPEPNYFIYTHRRGWIHCSEMTLQDYEERSGFMLGYMQ